MTQAGLWYAVGAATAIAVCAGLAEWRRSHRRDLDQVGVVPWGGLSAMAFVAAVIGIALALRMRG